MMINKNDILELQRKTRPLLTNPMPAKTWDINQYDPLFGDYFIPTNVSSPFFSNPFVTANINVNPLILSEIATLNSDKIIANVQLRGAGKTKQAFEMANHLFIVFVDFSGSISSTAAPKYAHVECYFISIQNAIREFRPNPSVFSLDNETKLFNKIAMLTDLLFLAGAIFMQILVELKLSSLAAFRFMQINDSIYKLIYLELIKQTFPKRNEILGSLGSFKPILVIDEAGSLTTYMERFLSRKIDFNLQTRCEGTLFHPFAQGMLASRPKFQMIGLCEIKE